MNIASEGTLIGYLKLVSLRKLNKFQYPTLNEFEDANIQIVYLGWFWKDWSIINNGMYSVTNGLQARDDIAKNTGDLTRVFSLDEDWVSLNQILNITNTDLVVHLIM